MEKISIKNYYMNLARVNQPQFRQNLMNFFDINYNTFYSWISRDYVPKKFHDEYKEFLKKHENKVKNTEI